MKVKGTKKLISKFESMERNISRDVDEILHNTADEYVGNLQKTARKVMIKGYWTGNLARSIRSIKTGNLSYEITSNAHYSGYVEFGTRYMNAEPFMKPTFIVMQQQLNKDLEKLLNN